MANTLAVCLIATFLCCTGSSNARQVPAHCARGPAIWCKNLRAAAECGAVQHCIATVWENRITRVKYEGVSSKLLSFFEEMKDVKELINNAYLANRMSSACRQLPDKVSMASCSTNTNGLEQYLSYLLSSKTTPETMCWVIEMCEDSEPSKVKNTLAVEEVDPISDDVDQPKHSSGDKKRNSMPELIGAEKCTWGPSYWCNNFSTGRECKAMHHCLTRVWPHMKFQEDNDDICKICKDMVQQARDQLLSNETQTELKEVFEGSCHLIPIKIVAKECMKLADEFVPELVETLSSQMNPTAVCSVAGLCNNPTIDQMLKNYNSHVQHFKECGNCKNTVNIMRNKFDETSYDDFLVILLQLCRKMSSLSDSCSMLMFKYYENIRAIIKKDLRPQTICHVSGDCAHTYHSHDEYIFPAQIEDGTAGANDDVPCAFCEQLVTHLRDVLIANTTEAEFYKVLQGLCKQSGKFQAECLNLAEEYYGIIYKYLTDDLKGNKICGMIGICNGTGNKLEFEPVAPLLLSGLASTMPSTLSHAVMNQPDVITMVPAATSRAGETPEAAQAETTLPQLPIERMAVTMPENKYTCSFCEYLLHYLQIELSDVKNEDYIRQSVMKSCDKLPKLVNAECKQFVTEYGPAVIALLVQEIDPASICPALRICPVQKLVPVWTTADPSATSNCPLCLFAVEQLETVLKDNKTEENIQRALEDLCDHLSVKLKGSCSKFVETYSKPLVELLLADLTAQEICIYLKLCKDKAHTGPLNLDKEATWETERDTTAYTTTRLTTAASSTTIPEATTTEEKPTSTTEEVRSTTPELKPVEVTAETYQLKRESAQDVTLNIDKYMQSPAQQGDYNHMKKAARPSTHDYSIGDVETNEIHDNTANGQPLKPLNEKSVCVICEFVMKEIDDQIKDKHNEDEIKRIVTGVCKRMPKSVRSDCEQFVDKYADLVISLLAQELNPNEVCEELKLCPPQSKNRIHSAKEEILDCAVCETVVMAVKKVLKSDAVDKNIVHVVEKACALLPTKYLDRCNTMMQIYGDSVIHLVEEYGSKQVCSKIGLCSTADAVYVRMYHEKLRSESVSAEN